jgi:hypothetical protein
MRRFLFSSAVCAWLNYCDDFSVDCRQPTAQTAQPEHVRRLMPVVTLTTRVRDKLKFTFDVIAQQL